MVFVCLALDTLEYGVHAAVQNAQTLKFDRNSLQQYQIMGLGWPEVIIEDLAI